MANTPANRPGSQPKKNTRAANMNPQGYKTYSPPNTRTNPIVMPRVKFDDPMVDPDFLYLPPTPQDPGPFLTKLPETGANRAGGKGGQGVRNTPTSNSLGPIGATDDQTRINRYQSRGIRPSSDRPYHGDPIAPPGGWNPQTGANMPGGQGGQGIPNNPSAPLPGIGLSMEELLKMFQQMMASQPPQGGGPAPTTPWGQAGQAAGNLPSTMPVGSEGRAYDNRWTGPAPTTPWGQAGQAAGNLPGAMDVGPAPTTPWGQAGQAAGNLPSTMPGGPMHPPDAPQWSPMQPGVPINPGSPMQPPDSPSNTPYYMDQPQAPLKPPAMSPMQSSGIEGMMKATQGQAGMPPPKIQRGGPVSESSLLAGQEGQGYGPGGIRQKRR